MRQRARCRALLCAKGRQPPPATFGMGVRAASTGWREPQPSFQALLRSRESDLCARHNHVACRSRILRIAGQNRQDAFFNLVLSAKAFEILEGAPTTLSPAKTLGEAVVESVQDAG